MLFVCIYTIQVQRGLKVISDGWKDEKGMAAAKTGLPAMAELPDCGGRNHRLFPVGAGAASYASLASFSSITLQPKRSFPGCSEKKPGMMTFYSEPRENLVDRLL